MTCKDCIHYDVCQALEDNGQASKIHPVQCGCFKDKSRFVELPCKVGDTVYVITDCSRIIMFFDNDYFTGTGAIECPFEDVCKFTECNDKNSQVLETCVSSLFCDDDDWDFRCEHINRAYKFNEIGKTVFLTKAEAEAKLKELKNE